MKKVLLLLGLVVFLAACHQRYDMNTHNKNNATAWRLSRMETVFITQTEDITTRGYTYKNSGALVSDELAKAMRAYSNRITVSNIPLNAKEDIKFAREKGFDYIIMPKILSWREYSDGDGTAVRAHVEVKLLMVNLRNDRVIKLSNLKATAGEELPFGVDRKIPTDFRSPQQIVPQMMRGFAYAIYETMKL